MNFAIVFPVPEAHTQLAGVAVEHDAGVVTTQLVQSSMLPSGGAAGRFANVDCGIAMAPLLATLIIKSHVESEFMSPDLCTLF
jgi:hypothetical protein